ncbi:hypothetical protein AB0L40_12735 [Patulibacter sp. NPDC049589]|uniref:hypothetical protein n=1 Tax=Patulibacter sp. NPDC049589 TaxID=3154731 RepID=UPI003415D7C2
MPDEHPHDDLRNLTVLREIGVDLRAAAAREDQHEANLILRARRLRHRRRFAIAGFAVSAIVAAVAIGPGLNEDGMPRLDAVASARAALSPAGDVVHLVMSGGPVQPDGRPQRIAITEGRRTVALQGRRIEQWMADRPQRFRTRTSTETPDGRPLGYLESGQAADGRGWELKSWNGSLRVSSRAAPDGIDLTGAGAPDAASAVELLLREKRFVDRGTTTLEGRQVRELVADHAGGSNGQGGFTADTRLRYFVDEASGEPVRIDSYFRPPLNFAPDVSAAERARITSQNSSYVLSARLTVVRYERVPIPQADPEIFQVPDAPEHGPGR